MARKNLSTGASVNTALLHVAADSSTYGGIDSKIYTPDDVVSHIQSQEEVLETGCCGSTLDPVVTHAQTQITQQKLVQTVALSASQQAPETWAGEKGKKVLVVLTSIITTFGNNKRNHGLVKYANAAKQWAAIESQRAAVVAASPAAAADSELKTATATPPQPAAAAASPGAQPPALTLAPPALPPIDIKTANARFEQLLEKLKANKLEAKEKDQFLAEMKQAMALLEQEMPTTAAGDQKAAGGADAKTADDADAKATVAVVTKILETYASISTKIHKGLKGINTLSDALIRRSTARNLYPMDVVNGQDWKDENKKAKKKKANGVSVYANYASNGAWNLLMLVGKNLHVMGEVVKKQNADSAVVKNIAKTMKDIKGIVNVLVEKWEVHLKDKSPVIFNDAEDKDGNLALAIMICVQSFGNKDHLAKLKAASKDPQLFLVAQAKANENNKKKTAKGDALVTPAKPSSAGVSLLFTPVAGATPVDARRVSMAIMNSGNTGAAGATDSPTPSRGMGMGAGSPNG